MIGGDTTGGSDGRGRVQRALERLYERLGTRVVMVWVAGSTLLGVATAYVTSAWVARYLRLSPSDTLLLVAIQLSLVVPAAIAILVWCKDVLRTLLSWSGDRRSSGRAAKFWAVGVRAPYVIVSRGVVALAIASVGMTVIEVAAFAEPAYSAIPVYFAHLIGLFAFATLILFAAELMLRPAIEEIAAHLPPDFEPAARGGRLRAKALAPLPAVTLFSALTVGAFVDLAASGPLRLTVAIAIALATVAVAGLIFLVVMRSTLDPLDELLSATRRVRAGDLTTRARIVTDDDLGQLTHSFNQMVVDLDRHAEELRASRARVVAAADEERRRLERDLHDGAQQQLVLAQLKVSLLERAIETDPAAAAAMTAELRDDLRRALGELRDLAHGLYPTVLESDGLPGALQDVAERSPVPATVDCDGAGRYPREVEAAVYFCCLEALQNSAKHAGGGSRATVTLAERASALTFEVADDGRGFDTAPSAVGAGLRNMQDRIGALGGALRVESAPGCGTRVIGSLPLAAGDA